MLRSLQSWNLKSALSAISNVAFMQSNNAIAQTTLWKSRKFTNGLELSKIKVIQNFLLNRLYTSAQQK